MKKFVSVLLTVAMLLSVCAVSLTGCAREKTAEEIEEELKQEQANAASTLVMWVVTEEGTDDEQARAVAKQLATITKSKYKTDLIVRYLTMDEYYTELEKAIAENERLIQVKALNTEISKAVKKADTETTGAIKKGGKDGITEAQKAEYFFKYLSDAIKVADSVVSGTTTKDDYIGASVTDEELEELLISVVGQLVEYKMADLLLEKREALIAIMENELANPPEASTVGKNYIYMTQTAIDMMGRLFDLTEEHKESFEKKENEEEGTDDKEEEEDKEDELIRDENGDMVVDTTEYPEALDHQADIIYISGYDKYIEYIENEWLLPLDSDIKTIQSYVSTSLLNAVKHENVTYAIPNNNIIGEYTYMLIDKVLFDKYYYTGMVDQIHSVSDVADFVGDIAKYEPDVLPINGDVDYCMSLIAHYWSINPENMAIDPGVFSVLGHAYAPGEVVTRGNTALTFSNLLGDENYVQSLLNLKEFEYAGYFGTPAEGQKSAISFVKGDASAVQEYEDDNYVIAVDYPKAADEDIYENMFGVTCFTTNETRSKQVLTLMNTDPEFRNLLQYGIEGKNYTVENGVAVMRPDNAYHMDIAKTGNQFIAYVPEGMNVDVWEFAKQQNRQSQVNPLLGFAFNSQLESAKEEFLSTEAETAEDVFYYVEAIDTDLIKYINEVSANVWQEIQACTDVESLETTINSWYRTIARDEKIKSAMSYVVIEDELSEEDGSVVPPDEDDKTAKKATVKQIISQTKIRKIEQETASGDTVTLEQKYFLVTKVFNPYQIYYRWMDTYKHLPPSMMPVE